MESIKVQAYLDSEKKLTNKQVEKLNDMLTETFTEFASEIGMKQNINITWSWWSHKKLGEKRYEKANQENT